MQFFVRSRQLPAAILLSRERLLESQFSSLSPLWVLDQRKVGSILFRAKSGDRGYDFRKARKTCSRSTVTRERSYDTRRACRRRDVSRRYKIYVSASPSGGLEINRRRERLGRSRERVALSNDQIWSNRDYLDLLLVSPDSLEHARPLFAFLPFCEANVTRL